MFEHTLLYIRLTKCIHKCIRNRTDVNKDDQTIRFDCIKLCLNMKNVSHITKIE